MNNARPPYGSLPPTGSPVPEPSPREKIARYLSLARRALGHWKLAALILAVGCGVALYVALHVKLLYRSECVILFKPAIKTTDRPDEESPADRAAKLAPKLKEVLTTRARLEQIIHDYHLYPKTVESKGMLEAVDEMRNHVGFRGRDSETFVISYENDSPEIAQKVTQRLADTMIDEFTRSSLGSAKQQEGFLAAQESRSEQEVENANKALATFLTIHPEFAVEAARMVGGAFGGAPTQPGMAMAPQVPLMPNLPKDPAAMGDPQLAVLYRQRARLEAEMKNGAVAAAAAGAGAPAVPAGADQIARLTAMRDDAAKLAAQAQADLADKRTRYTDEHPDVIAAKIQADAAARQLHQTEVQLAAAQAAARGQAPTAASPVAGSNPDLERRLSAIEAQIAARRTQVRAAQKGDAKEGSEAGAAAALAAAPVTNELVELETEWQRLLRVLHDVKAEHDDLKQRLERAKLTASAAEASGGDQMQVLDPAYTPLKPSKGGRTKTALMGGTVALLLALAYAFARVVFNDTLIDAADVEALQLVPVLGVVPRVAEPMTVPKGRARRQPRAGKEARGGV